jgi:RimJ/RimL family protein N-acetyltransferase
MPAPTTWKGAPVSDALELTGRHVRLAPLALHHAADLHNAGQRSDIWQFVADPKGPFVDPAHAERWIAHAIEERAAGVRLPFAIIHLATGRAIGSTSYYFEGRWANRTLEIGGTWLAPQHWRTAANTESKFLLLREAFEVLRADRVEFLTDARNMRSQLAIQRLGALKEGVLRAHMLLSDGHRRDSISYSILPREWPGISARLQALLKKR